jgi:hypothetical protein
MFMIMIGIDVFYMGIMAAQKRSCAESSEERVVEEVCANMLSDISDKKPAELTNYG